MTARVRLVAEQQDSRFSPKASASFGRWSRCSRRRLLALTATGATAVLAATAALRSAQADEPGTPVASHAAHAGGSPVLASPVAWEREELVEPEVRRSEDGALDTSLNVRYAYKNVGGYRLSVRSYEGTVPGPTMRITPGHVLKIRLTNDLPPNRDEMPADLTIPHHFNTTNFHAHGAHVDPGGISDNVFRSMEPGETHDIEMDFADDHPGGTYWYHPHHHGGADIQISSGMAGALIVEGDYDDVPEIGAATELVLVLGQVVFDELRMVENFDVVFSETATRFLTVNGQREPIMRMRPGEVQLWRILHAGYQDDLLVKLDGHSLHALARDGIRLTDLNSPIAHTIGVETEDPEAILFAPANRVDVLVQAGKPGRYWLHALPHDQGYEAPVGPLLELIVEGDPLPMALPESLPPPPFAPITDGELTGSRELTFSRIAPEVDAAGHWEEFRFLVDEQLFDPDRVDQEVELGAVEEWTVTNLDEHNDHVFHIHVNPFQLTRINGEAVAEPLWLDTAILPHGGSLTFRTRFLDYTGRTVLHCHMMNHEELGMMQVIDIAAPV